MRATFASESVTEGHPDKVCDKISDSVLDAALTLDPKARVACETLVSENLVVITGEVSESVLNNLDLESVAARRCARSATRRQTSALTLTRARFRCT